MLIGVSSLSLGLSSTEKEEVISYNVYIGDGQMLF